VKFIEVSDLHLVVKNPKARRDDLVVSQFNKLNFILKFAKDHDASILQAGDFFNSPRSWMLLPEVMDVLRRYCVDIYCVYGQHDTYMYSEETRYRTNLGILAKAGLVKILCDIPESFDDGEVLVYGAHFGSRLPIIDKVKGVYQIGVIHAPIAEAAIYPGQKYWDASQYLARNDGYNNILCADIHRSFNYSIAGRTILNTGPIIRKEATEYNFQHLPHVYLLDTNINVATKILVPAEDGEVVLDRSHIDKADDITDMMDSFVDSIVNDGTETNGAVYGCSFEQNLLDFYEQHGIEESVKRKISLTMEKRG
jgi:hypothetical protein